MLTRVPKGTKDVLPAETARLQALEAVIREKTRLANYREIRTPVFEHTELFTRSVGESSDVVRKEMYTFLDKGNRSVTLKPESTAGVARAFLEAGMHNQPLPIKLYYLYSPHFRYEAPQSGRLREHHQFGIECFGAQEASADAEVIWLAMDLLRSLGIKNITLQINSIGCPVCRPAYKEKLMQFLHGIESDLCDDCRDRIEINPLRVLDCKVESCLAELKDAPRMLDHLCNECAEHFESLQAFLKTAELPYTVDTGLVRGLDYYTKTVFEIIMETGTGSLTACGGGRYDGLMEELGGPHIPAVGFGMGMERVLMLLDALSEGDRRLKVPENKPDVFIAPLDKAFAPAAFHLLQEFRSLGLSADMNHTARGLRAQFKYADKLNAAYVAVLGEDEAKRGVIKLRDMRSGDEWEAPLPGAPRMLKERMASKAEKECTP